MSDWETLNCHYHPERIALERCEVCGKALCAYCLYYTDDGQRLCVEHAEAARAIGVQVDDPGTYADQLIGAQVGASRKQKRGETDERRALYQGNSTDLTGLVAMVLGLVGLGTCCGVGYCLPVFGFGLSIAALLNANKAHDKGRTRRLGMIGLLSSGVLVLAMVACIAFYVASFGSVFSLMAYPYNNWYTPPPTSTPLTSTPLTSTPSLLSPLTSTPDPNPFPTSTPAVTPVVTLPQVHSQLVPPEQSSPVDGDIEMNLPAAWRAE